MLGFTEEELQNKHCVDFSPREDAEKDWDLFQRLRAGLIDHYQLEKRYFRRDGALMWGHLSISLLKGTPPLIVAMVEDITEKKLAEEARFKHAAIIESSVDAIIAKNLDGIIVSWNAGAERIFGYTEAEAVGQPITILIPPDLHDEEIAILERLRAGGRIEHYETVRVTKAGKKVHVSLSISGVKDSTGRIVGFTKIAHDITERRLADQERSRLAAIVESSEDAIGGVDTNGTVVSWNKGAERLFGYTATEAIGRNISFLSTPDHPADGLNLLRKVLEGDVVRNYETVRVRKDGALIEVSVTISPILDIEGRIVGASGISRDITERKVAETALRISEERLRLAQWAAHVGTFDFDVRTGVDTWTPETEALYGLPPGGFDGTLNTFENLVHPDDRQKVMELTRKTITTGEPTDGEWRAVWPDGSVHWIAGRGQLLRDESGEPWRLIGVNIDITESKRAEEALLGMTRKLVEAQEEERARIARELHDDITQRVALLAMEIEQPAEPCEIPAELRARAHELAKRARAISSDIQTLSHELHSSTLELLGFEAGMKSWCREFGARRKLQIAFQSHNVPKLPREISLCLFRVLQEALQNAGKHSGAKQIEVRLIEDSGEIHLTVSDSGKGFEVKAQGQSRGLGLTSMQERVRLVNGTIEIQSKPMSGTTIFVRVPFKSDEIALHYAG